jgi:hypothetical protein
MRLFMVVQRSHMSLEDSYALNLDNTALGKLVYGKASASGRRSILGEEEVCWGVSSNGKANWVTYIPGRSHQQ